MEQRFLGAGHSAAAARLSSYFSGASACLGAMSGTGYYFFIKELLSNWDERAAELPQRLSALAQRIFTADEVLVSLTCSAEDRERFWDAAGTLGLPTLGADACAHKLEVKPLGILNEAFVIPANVCFAVEGQPRSDADNTDRGTWNIASRALSYDYLWDEVRVKGGAYGCGFRHNTTGLMQFWSYRDPAVDPTIERFERAAEWVANWEPTTDDLDGYIVSMVASHDAPQTAKALARRQDSLYRAQRPEGYRDEVREQMLAVTPEKVRATASSLAELPECRAICVFGGRDKIEASALDLNIVELLG